MFKIFSRDRNWALWGSSALTSWERAAQRNVPRLMSRLPCPQLHYEALHSDLLWSFWKAALSSGQSSGLNLIKHMKQEAGLTDSPDSLTRNWVTLRVCCLWHCSLGLSSCCWSRGSVLLYCLCIRGHTSGLLHVSLCFSPLRSLIGQWMDRRLPWYANSQTGL